MIPKNPYPPRREYYNQATAWQEGYESLKDWLLLPCTEHCRKLMTIETYGILGSDNIKYTPQKGWYHDHRYQCPECMKELKEAQDG